MKAILILVAFLTLFFYLVFPRTIFAVSLSIDNVPSTVDQSQEFEIDIAFSCSGCGDSYLRGVFYPSGSSYFGYTQDSKGNWSNSAGGSCTTYFKIAQSDLTEGSWSGKLRFKPDKDSTYYSGPKNYLFKVGRYTPSCSSPSVWSQEATIAITGPNPTSTPTSTPTNTPTKTPTPKPTSSPTSTPSPISTPTPTKKPSPTPTLKPSKAKTSTLASEPIQNSTVLGQSTEAKENTDTKTKEGNLFSGENLIAKIFIVLGVIFLILCGIVIAYPFIRRAKEEKFGG